MSAVTVGGTVVEGTAEIGVLVGGDSAVFVAEAEGAAETGNVAVQDAMANRLVEVGADNAVVFDIAVIAVNERLDA